MLGETTRVENRGETTRGKRPGGKRLGGETSCYPSWVPGHLGPSMRYIFFVRVTSDHFWGARTRVSMNMINATLR